MLTPDQIKQRALRKYWDFLRSLATETAFFPLVLPGSGHSRIDDFDAVRLAITILRQHSKETVGFGYEIEWQERSFRRFAAQRLPARIVFSSRDDFTKFIGKERETEQFEVDCHLIREFSPELASWAVDHPRLLVESAGRWPGLLAVCAHLRRVGPPDCYTRELPVEVATKFIEENKAILSVLLPIAAPLCVVAATGTFEERFGFKRKPIFVRFRFLDEAVKQRLGFRFREMAIRLEEFCSLNLEVGHVLVVENEMTFTMLPNLPHTIAVLGSGDTVAALESAQWLSAIDLWYWGDMDAHGFEALTLLRRPFPGTKSILMDEATFAAFREFAVPAAPYTSHEPLNLTASEKSFFNRLLADNVLLEQEHISLNYVATCLGREFSLSASNESHYPVARSASDHT
jgi:hypothetical protein